MIRIETNFNWRKSYSRNMSPCEVRLFCLNGQKWGFALRNISDLFILRFDLRNSSDLFILHFESPFLYLLHIQTQCFIIPYDLIINSKLFYTPVLIICWGINICIFFFVSKYVCMSAYVYVCLHMCMYDCIYVFMCVYVYILCVCLLCAAHV